LRRGLCGGRVSSSGRLNRCTYENRNKAIHKKWGGGGGGGGRGETIYSGQRVGIAEYISGGKRAPSKTARTDFSTNQPDGAGSKKVSGDRPNREEDSEPGFATPLPCTGLNNYISVREGGISEGTGQKIW